MTSADWFLHQTAERVQALLGDEYHQITVERAVFGLFYSGVKLSTGHGGLCFTPVKELPEAVCCPSSARAMPLSGKLAGRKVHAYIQDVFGGNILRRTLGIAALNALSALLWERGLRKTEQGQPYALEMGLDSFDALALPEAEKTVVVGALAPMLKKLMALGRDFTVLELDSRALKGKELEHYKHPDEAKSVVPYADLLVITGVTILNDTLAGLLKLVRPGARVLVTGPTASMIPDAFFQKKVTMLGGVIVENADHVLDLIGEAGSGYHFYGRGARRLVIRKA